MIEVWFAWSTLLPITVAAALMVRPGNTAFTERWTRRCLFSAALLAVVATLLRIIYTEHLPKFGTFEESLGSVAVILVHAALLARQPERSMPATVSAIVGAALLLHGLSFSTARSALTISELSWWLDLHVFAAWLAVAAFAVTVGGAVWLWRGGALAAEALTHRALQVGFVFHTAMMLSGAWYSYRIFGIAFSFDPIEVMALIAWLVTASVLHLRAYRGLHRQRFAVLALIAAVLLFASFRLIVHLSPASSYHVIDIDLRLHT